jgi:hypothetical protein
VTDLKPDVAVVIAAMLRLPDPNSQSASDRLKPLENANPRLHVITDKRPFSPSDADDNVTDDFDEREIFDLIRNINDPEHPLTLEQLDVVKIEDVQVNRNFKPSLFCTASFLYA